MRKDDATRALYCPLADPFDPVKYRAIGSTTVIFGCTVSLSLSTNKTYCHNETLNCQLFKHFCYNFQNPARIAERRALQARN